MTINNKDYQWLRESRTFLYDAYWPPFAPDLEYEPAAAIAMAKQMGANTIRFGCIGKWALYPSDIIPQHPDLEGRDLLGETMKLARDENIKMIAYVPVGHALPYKLVSEQRSQWSYILDDGKPLSPEIDYNHDYHYGGPRVIPICAFGPYYQDILNVVKEIKQAYSPDGFYLDGPYQGWDNQHIICQCEACKNGFKADTGRDLPTNAEISSETWDNALHKRAEMYMEWNRNKLIQLLKDIDFIVKEKTLLPLLMNRTAAKFSGSHFERKFLNSVDGFLVENTHAGLEGFCIGDFMGKMVWNYTNQHGPWPRMTSKSRENENHNEGLRTLAAGGTPIISYAGRFLVDGAHKEPVTDLFAKQLKMNDSISKTSMLKHALIFSPMEFRMLEAGALNAMGSTRSVNDIFNVLQAHHIPTMALPVNYLENNTRLDEFKLICLPGATTIDEQQAELLRNYVNNGGSLIVLTPEKGDVDQMLNLKIEMLQDVMGVSQTKVASIWQTIFRVNRNREDLYDCYLCMDKKGGSELGASSEFIEEFSGERLPQKDFFPIKVDDACKVVANTTCRYNKQTLSLPSITVNHYGRGKAVFINSPIDAMFGLGYSEPEKFFAGLADCVASEASPVRLKADLSISCYPRQGDGNYVLHLVQPESLSTTIKHLAFKVRDHEKIEDVSLLFSEKKIPVKQNGLWIELENIEFENYECLRLSYS